MRYALMIKMQVRTEIWEYVYIISKKNFSLSPDPDSSYRPVWTRHWPSILFTRRFQQSPPKQRNSCGFLIISIHHTVTKYNWNNIVNGRFHKKAVNLWNVYWQSSMLYSSRKAGNIAVRKVDRCWFRNKKRCSYFLCSFGTPFFWDSL